MPADRTQFPNVCALPFALSRPPLTHRDLDIARIPRLAVNGLDLNLLLRLKRADDFQKTLQARKGRAVYLHHHISYLEPGLSQGSMILKPCNRYALAGSQPVSVGLLR